MKSLFTNNNNNKIIKNPVLNHKLQGHNIVVHENAMSGVSPWVYPHKIPLTCPWIATGRYRVVRITNEWLLTTAIILLEQGQRTHQYKRTNTGGRASLVWTFSVSVCWYKHFPCLFVFGLLLLITQSRPLIQYVTYHKESTIDIYTGIKSQTQPGPTARSISKTEAHAQFEVYVITV